MHYLTIQLLFVCLLGTATCHHSVSPDPDYTTNVTLARIWFVGQWKLTHVSSQMVQGLNPTVPDIKLIVVANGQITVIKNGHQSALVGFEIVETSNALQLITTAQPTTGDWYLRNPTIRISSDRLFLDVGIALDLPGYAFERVP